MTNMKALFAAVLALVGCAGPVLNVCPNQEGHSPEIVNTTVQVVETVGSGGHPAQEFTVSVMTFVEGTNAVLWVNGQPQGLFTAAGAFIGPRTFAPRELSQEELSLCSGKPLATVYEMRVGAVQLEGNPQPLAQKLQSGQTLTLRVDVCQGATCTRGVEKTVTVE